MATATSETGQSLATLSKVVYGLYIASFFVGLTGLVGLVLAYVKRAEARGTIYESHFTNQIRTFWWSFVLMLIGGLTFLFGIGWLIMAGAVILLLYRTVKGFILVNDGKAYA